MNIHELNTSLKGSSALVECGNSFILLERNAKPDDFKSLSSVQSDSVRQIIERLNSILHDDVDYNLFLDGEKPDFQLVYDDGLNMGSGGGISFSSTEELYQILEALDLDELRGERLSLMAGFDEHIQATKGRVAAVRSVKSARKICKSEVKSFQKEMRQAQPNFAFLMLGEDSEGFGARACVNSSSHEEMTERFAEMVSEGFSLVSVCIDGKALSIKDVERYQKEALEGILV